MRLFKGILIGLIIFLFLIFYSVVLSPLISIYIGIYILAHIFVPDKKLIVSLGIYSVCLILYWIYLYLMGRC